MTKLRAYFKIARGIFRDDEWDAWFMYGGAEKIHLGACAACMYLSANTFAAKIICSIFNLKWKQHKNELWIYHPKVEHLVGNDDDVLRGLLCGVPVRELW